MGCSFIKHFAIRVRKFLYMPIDNRNVFSENAEIKRIVIVTQRSEKPVVICHDRDGLEKAVEQLIAAMESRSRFFILNGDIILDTGLELQPLMKNRKTVASASGILANDILQLDKNDVAGPISQKFLQYAWNNDRLRNGLSKIKDYSSKPVYDKHFTLRQPGYHQEEEMLVHGKREEAIPFEPEAENTVLREFCEKLRALPFKEDVDYVNMLGVFLMALAGRPLASAGKMFVMLDGDAPGLGKSLLAETVGLVSDGRKPQPLAYSSGSNEEMSKRIGAVLNSRDQSILWIDNVRNENGKPVRMTVLESLSSSETIALRVLGHSKNIESPNYHVWIMTMNDTKTSPDLADRGMLVRLSSERRTGCRAVDCYGEFASFVNARHREIRASFYGMIEYWKSLERPE